MLQARVTRVDWSSAPSSLDPDPSREEAALTLRVDRIVQLPSSPGEAEKRVRSYAGLASLGASSVKAKRDSAPAGGRPLCQGS